MSGWRWVLLRGLVAGFVWTVLSVSPLALLEWTKTPEHAHRIALELNNRYSLDGRDANSFANVGWIFGLHDRPWLQRDVYFCTERETDQVIDRLINHLIIGNRLSVIGY